MAKSTDSCTFSFLRVTSRLPKPRTRGLTEIRGPYYKPVGKRYLQDVLATMGVRGCAPIRRRFLQPNAPASGQGAYRTVPRARRFPSSTSIMRISTILAYRYDAPTGSSGRGEPSCRAPWRYMLNKSIGTGRTTVMFWWVSKTVGGAARSGAGRAAPPIAGLFGAASPRIETTARSDERIAAPQGNATHVSAARQIALSELLFRPNWRLKRQSQAPRDTP